MDLMKALALRETLDDYDLERLRRALVDEVDRYSVAIRGYSPEKMERYGRPYLEKLQARVLEVQRLITARGIDLDKE